MPEWPSGVPTREVSVGRGFSIERGLSLGVGLTVRSSRRVMVWRETGDRLGTYVASKQAPPGSQATLELPTTDAEGWVDENGYQIVLSGPEQVTHFYLIDIYLIDRFGKAIGGTMVQRRFIVPAGTGVLDLDLSIDAGEIEGDSISIPPEWAAVIEEARQAAADARAAANDAEDAADRAEEIANEPGSVLDEMRGLRDEAATSVTDAAAERAGAAEERAGAATERTGAEAAREAALDAAARAEAAAGVPRTSNRNPSGFIRVARIAASSAGAGAVMQITGGLSSTSSGANYTALVSFRVRSDVPYVQILQTRSRPQGWHIQREAESVYSLFMEVGSFHDLVNVDTLGRVGGVSETNTSPQDPVADPGGLTAVPESDIVLLSGAVTWDSIEGRPAVIAAGSTAAQARNAIGAATPTQLMTVAEAEAGTAITARTISAARLKGAIETHAAAGLADPSSSVSAAAVESAGVELLAPEWPASTTYSANATLWTVPLGSADYDRLVEVDAVAFVRTAGSGNAELGITATPSGLHRHRVAPGAADHTVTLNRRVRVPAGEPATVTLGVYVTGTATLYVSGGAGYSWASILVRRV